MLGGARSGGMFVRRCGINSGGMFVGCCGLVGSRMLVRRSTGRIYVHGFLGGLHQIVHPSRSKFALVSLLRWRCRGRWGTFFSDLAAC